MELKRCHCDIHAAITSFSNGTLDFNYFLIDSLKDKGKGIVFNKFTMQWDGFQWGGISVAIMIFFRHLVM